MYTLLVLLFVALFYLHVPLGVMVVIVSIYRTSTDANYKPRYLVQNAIFLLLVFIHAIFISNVTFETPAVYFNIFRAVGVLIVLQSIFEFETTEHIKFARPCFIIKMIIGIIFFVVNLVEFMPHV